MTIRTVIAGLAFANIIALILLAVEYRADPSTAKLVVAWFVTAAVLFGFWELLRPLREADKP